METADIHALKQLAGQHWRSQNFQACVGALDRILELEPNNGHLWNSRAMCLSELGANDETIRSFEQACSLQPDVAAFHQNLARALLNAKRWREAARAYKRALHLDPRSADCLRGLAEASSNLGNHEDQLHSLDELAALRDLASEERLLRAEALLRLERPDEALTVANSAIAQNPNHPGARLLRAAIYQQQGRHQQAIQDLMAAIEISPSFAPAYWYLTQSKKFTQDDAAIVSQMEALAASLQSGLDRGVIGFALGSAYNDLRQYERAIAAFDESNAILKSLNSTRFDRARMEDYFNALIATFDTEFFSSRKSIGQETNLPLFIVGMPRSGTTLTESILSSHPQVAAGGEIPFWANEAPRIFQEQLRGVDADLATQAAERYLQRLRSINPSAKRVTDKLPFNYLNVGLLHLLFPQARFVHCRRHPVDNCLSFYMTTFKDPPGFAHDRDDIVFAYRQYARLLAHWRTAIPEQNLLEVRYEDLVTNQEPVSRRLIEFSGLDWDDSCLHPERNRRQVSTMSHWQARQPVYASSVERWRNYEPWLGAFRGLIDNPPGF